MQTHHLDVLSAMREHVPRTLHIECIDAVLEFLQDWPTDANGNLIKPGQLLFQPVVGPRGGAMVNRWETPNLEVGQTWEDGDGNQTWEPADVPFDQCYPNKFDAQLHAEHEAGKVRKRLAKKGAGK